MSNLKHELEIVLNRALTDSQSVEYERCGSQQEHESMIREQNHTEATIKNAIAHIEELERRNEKAQEVGEATWHKWVNAGRGTGFRSVQVAIRAALGAAQEGTK